MKPDLKKYFSVSEKIAGCTLPKQAMLMGYVLNRMMESNIKGDMLELGVMEGKSAVLFAMALNEGETLHLVDMRLSQTRDELLKYIAETTDNKVGADRLKLDARFSHQLREDLSALRGRYRFIHIDAGHGYTDVYRDLTLADELLDREGIVIADDFFALGRPDVTEAVYEYVFAHPASFRIFLVGYNKALLCRPDRLSRWWPDTLKNVVAWFKAHDSNVMVHQYGSPLEKCSMAVYDRAPDAPAYGGFLAKPECTALLEALSVADE